MGKLRYLLGLKGPSGYGSASTAKRIALANKEYVMGKVVAITGSNSGLGKETAKVLAKNGATVVLVCRRLASAEETATKIKAAVGEDAQLIPMECDLSSMDSITKFTETFKSKNMSLNILINNAGIFFTPREMTKEGLESQFGVNHIGHFLLTMQLLDILKATGTEEDKARVVSLSSYGHKFCYQTYEETFGDLSLSANYSSVKAYGRSKLSNLLFAQELEKRMREEKANVRAYAVHPGMIGGTNITRNIHSGLRHFAFLAKPICKSIAQGAATTIYCATTATLDSDDYAGKYYVDCNQYPPHHPLVTDEVAGKLWDISLELTAGRM